ncbi:MAG: rhomboid family intramembrane serine protease [Gemmataceae bacterium]
MSFGSRSSPKSNSPPSLGDVLEWCAKAGPAGWFPSDMSAHINREMLYEPTLDLLRLGFIEAVNWERGRGQGFALTELGRSKLGHAFHLTTPTPQSITITPERETETPQNSRSEPFDRGEFARKSFAYFVPGRVSRVLLVIICSWFVYGIYQASKTGSTLSYLQANDKETVLKIGAVTGAKVYDGEAGRLITCNFVHIGLLHLFMNAYSLYYAGSFAERLWGSRVFLVIVSLSAIGGSSLAIALRPISILAGASAGIWGILVSIVVWMAFNHQYLRRSWVRDFFRRSLLIFAMNVGVSLIPGVSWEGHLGGALAGLFSACLLQNVRPGLHLKTLAAIAVLVLAIPLCVWSFQKFAESSLRWEPVRVAYHLLHAQSGDQELRQKSQDANRFTSRISLSRIINLHSNGARAVTTGNRNQLDQVSQSARELKEDAARAVDLLTAMADATESHSPNDAVVIRNLVRFFQHVAEFADRIESCTSATPVDMKRWLSLHNELKAIEKEFMQLATPQASNSAKP